MMDTTYDLLIIGTGFAGYTAAIYAARYKISHIIFGEVFGGQIAEAYIIGNYPGFEAISGPELMNRVRAQATKLGTEEVMEKVLTIENRQDFFIVTTANGKSFKGKNILLTTGMKRRKLQVPGEDQFYGKGVSYCATCDGYFYTNKKVAVIGGGNAALTTSLYLAAISSEVTLIVRGAKLKGETYWIDQVMANPKIKVLLNTTVERFEGTEKLEKLALQGEAEEVTVNGAFIEAGHVPDLTLISQLGITTDEKGFILVDQSQMTNVPHVAAAGDNTAASNKFAQLVTAASEAAIAVETILQGLAKKS